MSWAPDAFIFDLDGVIADTEPAHRASWAQLAAQEGWRFDDAVARSVLGRTREDSLSIVSGGAQVDTATRERWLAQKQSWFLEGIAQFGPEDTLPGVSELIEEIRTRGIPCGLASSSRNALLILDRLALTDRFDVIADGNSTFPPKPDPAIFLYVAQRLGAEPGRTVVIEDAPAGVAAARAGGFRVAGVGNDLDGLDLDWRMPTLAGCSVLHFHHR